MLNAAAAPESATATPTAQLHCIISGLRHWAAVAASAVAAAAAVDFDALVQESRATSF